MHLMASRVVVGPAERRAHSSTHNSLQQNVLSLFKDSLIAVTYLSYVVVYFNFWSVMAASVKIT